jgi:hypothetical protein
VGFVNFISSLSVQLKLSRGGRGKIGRRRLPVCDAQPAAQGAPITPRLTPPGARGATSVTIYLSTPRTRRGAPLQTFASRIASPPQGICRRFQKRCRGRRASASRLHDPKNFGQSAPLCGDPDR